jgi:hypothetical protein
MYAYTVIKEKNIANVSTDRIIRLIPGERGAIDSYTNRSKSFNLHLFKNSELHAIQDNGLWYLKMIQVESKKGVGLPEALNQRWTNFNQMMKFLTGYFLARNVQIQEIIS